MDIGNGFYISNQYFEGAERIGKQDRTGIELAIGDKVAIRGCRARFGYIGRSAEGKSVVYFATTTTTAMWELTPTTLDKLTLLIEKPVQQPTQVPRESWQINFTSQYL